MKKRYFLVFSALLAIFPAAFPELVAAASSSPEPDSTVVKLPTFSVTADTDRGYLAANSVSASRVGTAIMDLPFAISAFTPQFIEDIKARELFDVVQYAGGVSSGSNEFQNGNTQFMIRGFNQYPEHDGFYEAKGDIYVDTANIERVEVVKGPASILYGAIAPGGTVNYITKMPLPNPFVTIGATWGTYAFARTTIDVNQPLVGDSVLFRLNVAWENNFQWLMPSRTTTVAISPTLRVKITPWLSLTLRYQDFDRIESPPAEPQIQMFVTTPNSLTGTLYNPGFPTPTAPLTGKTGIDADMGYGSDGSNPGFLQAYPAHPANANYASYTDSRRVHLQTIDAEADANIGNHLTSRANFNFNRAYFALNTTGADSVYLAPPNSLVFGNGVWSVSPAWTALTAAQQLAAELAFAQQVNADSSAALQSQNGTAAPAIMSRNLTYYQQKSNTVNVQWDVAGLYTFPWGMLKPLAGLYYDNQRFYLLTRQTTGSASSPNFRPWDLDPSSPTYYINHNTPAVNSSQLTSTAKATLSWASNQAVYALLNASFFGDRLNFVGGVRYNASQSQTTNYLAAAGTNPVGQGYRTHYTTPQVGMGYKLLKDMMLYASYSESYQLPSTTYLSTLQTVNGVLQTVPSTQALPVIGKGSEVGIKTDFLKGRVSSTVSVFRIEQYNVLASVNQNINGLLYTVSHQSTEVRSQGIEMEATLTPVENWQVFISASECDTRNVAEPLGYLYYLGEHPAYSAKTLANLWTRYNFASGPFKGLWIGGGVNYAGPMQQDQANKDAFTDSYTLWKAAAGYDWTWNKHKMSLTLNGNNLSNVTYNVATQVRGVPRNILLSITGRF